MMLSMRLLLIRHGQTTSNVMHALDTSAPGADLTELGRTQAAVIPEVLSDERIDGLYVSNLVRTQQTAQPLADARALTPITRLGIREISAGALEMRSDDEALKEYIEVVFGWPGLGRLVVDAIQNRDFPLVQGAVLVLAVLFVLVNLITDIVQAWLDPRIKLTGGGSR